MQNKGAIWIFTILLTLACLYQLSFSFVTASYENKAEKYAVLKADSVAQVDGELSLSERAGLEDKFASEFLKNNAGEPIYPIFGYSYQECKSKELNLGLDLAGGMSVTLEVSLPDLVIALSGDSRDADFRKAIEDAKIMQRNAQDDFISLFGRAWNQNFPDKKLAAIFHNRENKEKFPRDASNNEVIDILKDEAKVAINNTEKILRTRIDKFGVAQPTIQKQQFSGRILIELPGVKDKERVRNVIQSTANLEFWNTYENSEILPILDQANEALSQSLYPELYEEQDTVATENEEEIANNDTEIAAEDPLATAEEAVADTTEDDLLQSLSADSIEDGIEDNAGEMDNEEQMKRFPLFSKLNPAVIDNQMMTGAVVGFANLGDTSDINAMLSNPVVKELLPADLKLLWSAKPDTRNGNVMSLYAIRTDSRNDKAPLDGASIIDAAQQYDVTGQVEVSMNMDSEGARIWKNLTAAASAQNPKRSIAIVLDDYVYSAPVVMSEIPTGRSSISMGAGTRNEQIEDAVDLANLLKAGALPAPASIVDEAVVGPSLGQKNIDAGLISFAIALAVVLTYMILYYRGAGIVADIALVANLFFLIGALASIQASLTLPGIAGIILTIGMAVDANVLIFERVREELRQGKGLKVALHEGYNKAYSAIIDSNLTTLLTAIVLVTVGTGPIKGFATTLIIGIFTSLFCAIFITRLLFTGQAEKGKNISFWTGWSKEFLTSTTIPFLSKRKIAYTISSILIIVGIGSMVIRGFNLGVDFSGGRTYTVAFDDTVQLDEVRSVLNTAFIDENDNPLPPEVKTFGASNQVKITTKYLVDEESTDADGKVEAALRSGLDQIPLNYSIQESRKVDPTISDDFKTSATTAVVLSLILIFVYIVFRFKRWQYGFGAVVGMFHDVIIVLGIYSLFYGILPFSLEIDQAFIAAILTVVGYTINDTVIVFDRIREYLKEHPKEELGSVVDKALNSTLSRTINTSLTTIIVLLVIFLFGGESIRGFIFALLIGVVVGTFSSLFISAPIVVDLSNKVKERRQALANANH